jgi:hypothetical protein
MARINLDTTVFYVLGNHLDYSLNDFNLIQGMTLEKIIYNNFNDKT